MQFYLQLQHLHYLQLLVLILLTLTFTLTMYLLITLLILTLLIHALLYNSCLSLLKCSVPLLMEMFSPRIYTVMGHVTNLTNQDLLVVFRILQVVQYEPRR